MSGNGKIYFYYPRGLHSSSVVTTICKGNCIIPKPVQGDSKEPITLPDDATAAIAFTDTLIPRINCTDCSVIAMYGSNDRPPQSKNFFRWGYPSYLFAYIIAKYLESKATTAIQTYYIVDTEKASGANFCNTLTKILNKNNFFKITNKQFNAFQQDIRSCLDDVCNTILKDLNNTTSDKAPKEINVILWGHDWFNETVARLKELQNSRPIKINLIVGPHYTEYNIIDGMSIKCFSTKYNKYNDVVNEGNGFVNFANALVSLCNTGLEKSGGDRNKFSLFLKGFKFYPSVEFSTFFFRDDGELFFPLYIYDENFRREKIATDFIAYCHKELQKEIVAEQLVQLADLIEFFDPNDIDRKLNPGDALTALLNGCCETIKNVYSQGKASQILQIDFISKHKDTVKDFYHWNSPEAEVSSRSRDFENALINALQNIFRFPKESNFGILELVELMSQEKPIQINLRESDLENNDAYRVYIKTSEDLLPLHEWWSNKNADIAAFLEDEIQIKNKLVALVEDIEAMVVAKSNILASQAYFDYDKIRGPVPLCHDNGIVLPHTDNSGEAIQRFIFFDFILYKHYFPTAYFLYFIPETKINQEKCSGIIMPTTVKLTLFDLQILTNVVSRVFVTIHNALDLLDVKIANTKSAIGSIMSRNGSHNIGSHVLAALTHNVGTMPDDRVLYQYIQQRMDYIATVTTDFPNWGTPTMFVGDIMKTFFSQRHLLEYIAGSEGLHAYRFDTDGEEKQSGTIKLHIRRIHENIRAAEEGKKNEDGNVIEIGNAADWELAENALDHALHFIRYPDRKGTHYKGDDENKLLPLEHDVALAIPGGVVGEHAFFTILENIIRNAAKHGWATRKKDNIPGENLEIYVDFVSDPNKDHVEFTIWDNMSDVLKPLRLQDGATVEKYAQFLRILGEVKADQSAELKFADGQIKRRVWIKKTFENWPEALCLFLELQTDISDDRRKSKEARLSEIKGAKDLDSVKRKLEECVKKNASDAAARIDFEKFLQEPLTEAERSALDAVKDCIPLHWCQQIQLAEPLIGEQGELRRRNWGLAEMKISAGYLVRRSIAEIGGLESDIADGKDPIILPVAIPGVCDCKGNPNGGIRCIAAARCHKEKEIEGCPIDKKRYHLGYRFKVPKPREMLIVLPKETVNVPAPNRLAEFKKHGVYFAKAENAECYFLNDVNGEPDINKPADFNFEYVVFPDDGTAQKCGEALLKDDNHAKNWKSQFPFRLLYNGNIPTGAPLDLKDHVYDLWLTELKSKRSDLKYLEKITIQLQTEEEYPGSDGGLITARDILAFVLRNHYQQIIDDLAKTESYKKSLDILNRFVYSTANLLKLLPGKSEEEKSEKIDKNNIDGKIKDILADVLYKKYEQNDVTAAEKPVQEDLTAALLNAYNTVDALLRKKDISSLPCGYSVKNSVEKNDAQRQRARDGRLSEIGITLVNESPLIKYCRHDYERTEHNTIYAEALSGSQSYLNTLQRALHAPDERSVGLFVRLAENAFIRLLIIDERVCKFLHEHPDCVARFEAMNIDVAEISDNNTQQVDTKNKNIILDKLPLISDSGTGKNWDMLIIHQGVIDKWFPADHGKTAVGTLIEHLQEKEKEKEKEKERYIVVTTGRGRPANIPAFVKVIPFAMLESTLFLQNPEKMLLVNAVMNALPSSDIHGNEKEN